MPGWRITATYMLATVIAGLILPRLENHYFPSAEHWMSVASAQAFLSSVTSGMMALTGIVFSLAFVAVQFASSAYSPRLVSIFARDPVMPHSLGMFVATFGYSLSTLGWVDRDGSGVVPLLSIFAVSILVTLSMFRLANLVQRMGELQITHVLRSIGKMGRESIRESLPPFESAARAGFEPPQGAARLNALGPAMQTLRYSGEPRSVIRFDIDSFVRLANDAGAVIVLECAVGDTLVEGAPLLRVHGAAQPLSENALAAPIRLGNERTTEWDPKYALRLLVDIAIRALSPAVNDPTTAVQALDYIEDLLSRIGRRELATGFASDARGELRVVFPTPTWEDYIALAFDEIRNCGADQLQVLRRMRAALSSLAASVLPERAAVVRRYLEHLDLIVERSALDADDRSAARMEDRQGIGVSR
jgi:uncharacterized membrane protein